MKLIILLVLCVTYSLGQVQLPHRFGGIVVAASCKTADANQVWYMDNTHNTLYLTLDGANYCLDMLPVLSNTTSISSLYYCDNNYKSPTQHWNISSNNQIVSTASQCLTLSYIHGSDIQKVIVSECMGIKTEMPFGFQQWDINTLGNGNRITNRLTGMCLQLKPASTVLTDKYNTNPVVIGHRGSTFDAPENTMPAFVSALDLGAGGFETDLRITKDNVCVLIHDDSVDRTSNCKGKVRSLTYAQLLQCDFGKWFDGKFAGTKISTLDEIVKMASARNAYIVLDLKELGTPEEENVRANEMKRVLELYDFHSLAIASCRNENQVKWFNWLLNGTTLQHLEDQPQKVDDDRAFWKSQIQLHLNGFSLKQQTITPEFVRTAHKRLISIFAWTPDTVSDQMDVLLYGLDGIITGDVKMMLEIDRYYRGGYIPMYN
jgi:glycerophosphoryl diester phosphodiesterase